MEEEFENYDPHKLHRSFITLEAVMFEVMKDKGGNQYKLPHLHKDRIHNGGREIINVYCDSQVVVDTRAIIEEMEIAIGKENERKELAIKEKRKKSKGKGREGKGREEMARGKECSQEGTKRPLYMSCSQVVVDAKCSLCMSCVILCQGGTKRLLCHVLVYALISTPCWNLLEFGLFGI